MREDDWLAERFEHDRTHLHTVAYRMLGSHAEADDAVQEAWIRLARTDTGDVANLTGWLTTVVGRICLDMLRSRSTRREDTLDAIDSVDAAAASPDPEQEAVLADSIGVALLVVLETLSPAERLAFVLHDLFAVPFDDIAPILGRSPDNARQLASRARRRVHGTTPTGAPDTARQREVVEAFLAAARGGDFEALVTVLDPDVVLRSDATAVRLGSSPEATGAATIAGQFLGKASEARATLIDGVVGAVWAPGGRPRVALRMTIVAGRIAAIEAVADPDRLADLDLQPLA